MEVETPVESVPFPNQFPIHVDLDEKPANELAQDFQNLAVGNGDVRSSMERAEFYDNRQHSLFILLDHAVNGSANNFAHYDSSIRLFKKDLLHIQRFLLGLVDVFYKKFRRLSNISNLQLLFRHMNKMRDAGREMFLETKKISVTVQICAEQRQVLREMYRNLKFCTYNKQLNDIAKDIVCTFESNLKVIDLAIVRNNARRLLYKEYEVNILNFLV